MAVTERINVAGISVQILTDSAEHERGRENTHRWHLRFHGASLPPGMTRQAAAAWIREDPQAADKVFRDLMSASTGTRRAVQNGMFTFACPSPAAWFPAALDCTLAGVSSQIRCPALVIGTEAERAFKGQARTLYDAHLPHGIPDAHHRGRRRGPLPGGLAVCCPPSAPSTGSGKPQPRTRP